MFRSLDIRRPATFILGLLTLASVPATAQESGDEAGGQDPCLATDAIQLDLTELWSGDFAEGQTQCFVLEMTQGSFARLRLGLERGHVYASLFAPGDTTFFAATYAATGEDIKESVLAWAAVASGNYLLRVEAPAPSQAVHVELESLESPELYAARTRAVEANPRVRSLSNHMLRLNSIDPEDDDFSDLMPLREILKGVRIVMLGEATHSDGSDFLAKGRLIRFLHSELGFDVLAFESGIYQMRLAWEAFRAGVDPQEAFSKGGLMWAASVQVEPLVRYVSHSLSTDRPLELAGIDYQLWRAELPRDLREFLERKDIATPFANPNSPESEILAAMSEIRFRREQQARPDSAMKVRFVESLVQAADEMGKLEPTREVMFWQRVLVNMVQYTRGPVLRMFDESEGVVARDRQLMGARDRQMAEDLIWIAARERMMAENLSWMAREFYPDSKIIVWCHSGHAMRALNELTTNPFGPGLQVLLGDEVWKEFGKEMYSIAPVSYEGRWTGWEGDYTVVSDQVPEAEFEELMAATGQTAALVDLRQANERASWLGGSFVARPLEHISLRSVWSHHFDAFLFLRTQEPSERRQN